MATLTKEEIVDAVSTMSLLEVADLVKMFEEKFGVSAAAPVAFAAPGAGGAGGAAAEEEQTEFDVILTDVGASKINVMKVVREITGLGLKEAKDLVDNPPKPIKEGISKEDAAKVKEQIEAQGGKAEIK